MLYKSSLADIGNVYNAINSASDEIREAEKNVSETLVAADEKFKKK